VGHGGQGSKGPQGSGNANPAAAGTAPLAHEALCGRRGDDGSDTALAHPVQTLAPPWPGIGSSSSKSGALSVGKAASDAGAAANATAVKGDAISASSSLARGVDTTTRSNSLSTSTTDGAARAAAAAASVGAFSAAAAANATARAVTGRQSSSSSSSSSAGTARKGLFGVAMLPALPGLPTLPAFLALGPAAFAQAPAPSALHIMGGAFAKSYGLKKLLPKVPKITPGLASDAPDIEAAVAAANATAAPPLCNATITVNCTAPSANGTEGGNGTNVTSPLAAMSGLFGGLIEKNAKFMARNAPPPPYNLTRSARVALPARAPAPPSPLQLAAAAAPPAPPVASLLNAKPSIPKPVPKGRRRRGLFR
jgi:hypothetical protein